MRNRRAATRFALRRMVRRGQLDRAKAKWVLSDDDATDLVSAFVQDHIDQESVLASEDGPIISFIKWMIENQDLILAFIEALIALFEPDEP